MTGPAWLAASLAVLMLLIASASAARLAICPLRGRRTQPDSDGLHLLMGVAMGGMLEPRLSPFPDTAWTAVFAAAAAWFTWQAIRARTRGPGRGWICAHPAPHAVECGAMIYMLLPGRPAGRGLGMAMPGMSGPTAANPAIALILAMFMLGYILWTADQIAAWSRSAAAERAGRLTVASSGRPAAAAVHAAAAAAVSADSRPAISAPWLAACCKITMSIAMGYMLVGML